MPADRCGGLNRVWRTRAALLGYLYPVLFSGAATEVGLTIHQWIRRDHP